tara:strand:+ start:252 stop:1016 length:765 start_codon:yes stop_codon:yes gene_type:complete
MQSYLGEYPGARKDPETKFIRAVYSVIAQKDSNWELIIVSDGCKITERLYLKHFKNFRNIKFFMVEKPKNSKMNILKKSYFRGKPRALGVEKATGNWICYLDTDDFYTDNAVGDIIRYIKKAKEIKPELRYIFNNLIIESHILIDFIEKGILKFPGDYRYDAVSSLKLINGIPGEWAPVTIAFKNKNDTFFPSGTYSIIHKKGYPSWSWGDKTDASGSEDNAFIKPISEQEDDAYKSISRLEYYVRCHHQLWDL